MAGFFKRRYQNTKKLAVDGLQIKEMVGLFDYVKGIFIQLFQPHKLIEKETFEEAIARLGLTEEMVQEKIRVFRTQLIIYSVSAVGAFLYTVYLAHERDLFATFIGFLIACLLIACALRSHFWLFQLKKRKLGCTFQEWLRSSSGGKKE